MFVCLFHCLEKLIIEGNHLWGMTHRHYVTQCNFKFTQFHNYGARKAERQRNSKFLLKTGIIFYFGYESTIRLKWRHNITDYKITEISR